jgi:hypothetical protein
VGLYAVGIGTSEKAQLVAEHVGYSTDKLLADPDNLLYDALQLNSGLQRTFFSPATPYAILDRLTSQKMGDLNGVLGRWKDAFIIPPKQAQALNQGGLFVFDGEDSAFVHYDASTGAHGDLDRAVAVALARA